MTPAEFVKRYQKLLTEEFRAEVRKFLRALIRAAEEMSGDNEVKHIKEHVEYTSYNGKHREFDETVGVTEWKTAERYEWIRFETKALLGAALRLPDPLVGLSYLTSTLSSILRLSYHGEGDDVRNAWGDVLERERQQDQAKVELHKQSLVEALNAYAAVLKDHIVESTAYEAIRMRKTYMCGVPLPSGYNVSVPLLSLLRHVPRMLMSSPCALAPVLADLEESSNSTAKQLKRT